MFHSSLTFSYHVIQMVIENKIKINVFHKAQDEEENHEEDRLVGHDFLLCSETG